MLRNIAKSKSFLKFCPQVVRECYFENCNFNIYLEIKFFMYDNQKKDLVGAALVAALGAGVVTSFAVSQGQHPLIALSITLFSALVAVICHQADWI